MLPDLIASLPLRMLMLMCKRSAEKEMSCVKCNGSKCTGSGAQNYQMIASSSGVASNKKFTHELYIATSTCCGSIKFHK